MIDPGCKSSIPAYHPETGNDLPPAEKSVMSRQSDFRRYFNWLPGLRLLLQYDRACLPHDLTAGVVVTLVLIPSAIAYADLAKCPPIAGLYAALGGMVAFALFTSSRHVIVGPDAALAIM